MAQRKPEDFDGHSEFYRLTPEQRSNGYARRRRSFTSSKAKRILTLGTAVASPRSPDRLLNFSPLLIHYQLPHMTAHSSLIGFCLALLAATAFAGTSPVQTVSQRNGTPTPAVLQLPAPKQGLNFVVGAHGLDSLSFNGQSLLVSPESGELQPQKSVFRAVLDALRPRSSSQVATPNKQADTIDLSYPWGRISCAYGKQDDRITMRIEVSISSTEPLNEFSLRLMDLSFPAVPDGGTLEAGMFGYGFKGPEWPLHQYPPSIPSVADPRFVVPIVRVDYGTDALNFCSDDVECAVDVPSWTNLATGTSYPLVITCRDIKPDISKAFNVSLRFGPAGARV